MVCFLISGLMKTNIVVNSLDLYCRYQLQMIQLLIKFQFKYERLQGFYIDIHFAQTIFYDKF